MGDITYLSMPGGWLYLAFLMDTFSRRIVGWSVSSRIDAASRPLPGLKEIRISEQDLFGILFMYGAERAEQIGRLVR